MSKKIKSHHHQLGEIKSHHHPLEEIKNHHQLGEMKSHHYQLEEMKNHHQLGVGRNEKSSSIWRSGKVIILLSFLYMRVM